tara:strand:+ start:399 stop:2069 length:1671 start_codon:yes stop_codon:yes gene_type:complete
MVQIIQNPSGFAGYSINPSKGTFTAPFMGFTNQRIPLPKNASVPIGGRSLLDNVYGLSTDKRVAANPPSVVAFNNAMNQGLLNRNTPTRSSGAFVDQNINNPYLRNNLTDPNIALEKIPENLRQYAKIVNGQVVFDYPEELETQNPPVDTSKIPQFNTEEEYLKASGMMNQQGQKTKTSNIPSLNTEEEYLKASGLINQVGQQTPQETKTIKDKASQIGKGLIDFSQSPAGQGFITGLLKASGYSTTPVGFGQALGLAFEESNKAVQQDLANQLAKDKLKLAESQVGKFEQVMIEVPDGKGGTRKVPANRNTVTGEIKPIISASGNVFNMAGNQSKGFTALNQAAAKTVNEWTISGGFAQVKENVDKLDDVIKILEEQDNITGSVVGNIPPLLSVFINPEAVGVQDDINSIVFQSLRATLGAQFTENEGRKLVEASFNNKLDESVNIKRLQRLKEKLLNMAQAKQNAADYFYANDGNMEGFTGQTSFGFDKANASPEEKNNASQSVLNDIYDVSDYESLDDDALVSYFASAPKEEKLFIINNAEAIGLDLGSKDGN